MSVDPEVGCIDSSRGAIEGLACPVKGAGPGVAVLHDDDEVWVRGRGLDGAVGCLGPRLCEGRVVGRTPGCFVGEFDAEDGVGVGWGGIFLGDLDEHVDCEVHVVARLPAHGANVAGVNLAVLGSGGAMKVYHDLHPVCRSPPDSLLQIGVGSGKVGVVVIVVCPVSNGDSEPTSI